MANIAATRRREGKIMICRCKHSCQSQGRSPVLDCPGRPYKPHPPWTELLCKQVIIFDVRQGSLGSRNSYHTKRTHIPWPRQRYSQQHALNAGRYRTRFPIGGYETP